MIFLLICTLIVSTAVSCKDKSTPPDNKNAQPFAQSPQTSTLPRARLDIAGEKFIVELAFTRPAISRGLMFRTELPTNSGMLFIFAKSRLRSFYMKNCLIDLDILYIKPDGQIATITTMRAPLPGQPLIFYPSKVPVKFALELPVGTAQRLNLLPGDFIEIPPSIRSIKSRSD